MDLKTHIKIYNKLKQEKLQPLHRAEKYRQKRASKHIQKERNDTIDYRKLQKNSTKTYNKLYRNKSPFSTRD